MFAVSLEGLALTAVANASSPWPPGAGGISELGSPKAGIISGDASALGISVSVIAVLMH